MADTTIAIANDTETREYPANSRPLETTSFLWINWDSDNDYSERVQVPGSDRSIYLRPDQINAILYTADRMGGGTSVPDAGGSVSITVNTDSGYTEYTCSIQALAEAIRNR